MSFNWLSHLKSRRAITLGLSVFLPLFAIAYFVFLLQEGEVLDQNMEKFEKKAKSLSKQKQQKERFFQRSAGSDPHFIQTTLEPLVLLSEELDLLVSVEGFYEPLQKRVAYITENKMHFVKGEIKRFSDYSETVWRLERPVEVSQKDLSMLFSLIEGIRPSKPQLGIQKCLLTQKEGHYMLDLEIVQYEKS